MCTIYDVLSHFMLFCCKIVIYAVLSRYLFCRDLRAFAWRKIQPRIAPVEKKLLISGMGTVYCSVSTGSIWPNFVEGGQKPLSVGPPGPDEGRVYILATV